MKVMVPHTNLISRYLQNRTRIKGLYMNLVFRSIVPNLFFVSHDEEQIHVIPGGN
uniref:Uncharacterized protein n=1 Tax=Neogobius melanostomus TaxID=47308 RepID=A0A8C6UH54_9GOBI